MSFRRHRRSRLSPTSARAARAARVEPLEQRRLLAAVYWDGGAGNGLWNTGTNWSNDAVPTAADDVTIDFAGNYTVTLTGAAASVNSLTVGAPSGTQTLAVSTGLTIASASSFAANTVYNQATGGALSGAGNVTFNGQLNWSGGSMSGGGQTIVAAGATMGITGSVQLVRTLQNAGTATWSGGTITFNAGTFDNTGTFTASSALPLSATSSLGPNAFNNAGSFVKQGAGTASFQAGTGTVPFNNAGTVDVQAGTLGIDGGGTQSGDFTVAAGATLRFGGGSAAHSLAATSDISGGGSLLLNGSAGFASAGTVDVGATSVAAGTQNFTGASFNTGSLSITGGTLSLSTSAAATAGAYTQSTGGSLGGSGNLVVSGSAAWTGGSMGGTGTTVIDAGATIAFGGNVTLGRPLQNDGTANWSAGTIGLNAGTLTNNGTFNAGSATAANLTMQGVSLSSSAFVNNGTFNKTLNGLVQFTSPIGPAVFSSSGTVDVQAGTLSLAGGSGNYTAATNTFSGGTWLVAATLNIPATIRTLAAGTSVALLNAASAFTAINSLTTNNGTFTLAGGRDFAAAPFGGTFANAGTLNLAADSTLSVTGAFTQTGPGSLNVEIASLADFGRVTASGAATVDGALDAALLGLFDPGTPDSFAVVSGVSRSGTFAFFSADVTPAGRLLSDRYNATAVLVSARPLAPSSPDLTPASDSGASDSDDLTNNTTPTFDGTSTEDAAVNVYADGILVGTGVVSGGVWSVAVSSLADGVREITATIVDAEGDESPASPALFVTIDTAGPTGDFPSGQAPTSGAATFDLTVIFADAWGIDVSSLDDFDVRVTGPGGFDQPAVFVSVDVNSNGTPRTATYRINAPGGTWDAGDQGTYTVLLEGAEVADVAGNFAAAATLGTFDVNLASDDGAISGVLFEDINGNGAIDPGDPALAGRTVYIDADNDGVFDAGEVFTLTNGLGEYSFTVTPGAYLVRQVVPSGWYQTTPSADAGQNASVAGGQNLVLDPFGSAQFGQLSGVVFFDKNGNGVQDSNESGRPQWRVYLDLNNSGTFETGEPSFVTGGGGAWSLTGLRAGAYTVRAAPPNPDWNVIFPVTSFHSVTVTSGSNQSGVNFGVQPGGPKGKGNAFSRTPVGSLPTDDNDGAGVLITRAVAP